MRADRYAQAQRLEAGLLPDPAVQECSRSPLRRNPPQRGELLCCPDGGRKQVRGGQLAHALDVDTDLCIPRDRDRNDAAAVGHAEVWAPAAGKSRLPMLACLEGDVLRRSSQIT